jgi:putative phosphoesterase
MKIGLISDIHGNSMALAGVLAILREEVDQILFLGDLCGYYPFVDECVSLWDENCVIGVRGNHDQVFLDCLQSGKQPNTEYEAQFGSALRRTLQNLSPSSVSFLQSLPLSRTVTQNGITIALYHGSPWNPLEGRVYPDYDNWGLFGDVPHEVILLGHTHYQVVKGYKDKLIINPGSVGQPRDHSGEACFAILDTTSGNVRRRRVPFDPRRLIGDAREHDPDFPYLVEVLIRR